MSLTSDFLNNPQSFIRTRVIGIPGGIPPRDGKFKLVENGTIAALLQTTTESVRINGYYVRPLADNNNIYTLPTQQPDTYYMLTDLLNGCQFIAYGQDRQHLTVEHNNFISNPNNYAVRLANIQSQNYPYLWHLTATPQNNIPNGTYNPMQGANIIGEYTGANGWKFWVRDRLDLDTGTVYGPF